MPLADIIIVDDNPAIREALAEYLLDCGFAVRTANDGAALDLLLQARPAAALVLDVNLPNENGYAIASRVRQASPRDRHTDFVGPLESPATGHACVHGRPAGG